VLYRLWTRGNANSNTVAGEDKIGHWCGIFIWAIYTLSQISLLSTIVVFNYLAVPFNVLSTVPATVNARLKAHHDMGQEKRDVIFFTVIIFMVILLVSSAMIMAFILVGVCVLAAVALYVKLIQVYPLIASQNNPIQDIFQSNGNDAVVGLENVFRFIALCINIGGLYQEPSRIHFWRAHRIKDTWFMGRIYNRHGLARVVLYHLSVSHQVAIQAFWEVVRKQSIVVSAPEGFDTSDSFLNN